MKYFDIIESGFDTPIGEPGSVKSSLKEKSYTIQPIGWDEEENEPIYAEGPIAPEEVEKIENFRCFRLILLRHTKPESERTSPTDGVVRKALESEYWDSRIPEHRTKALHQILGAAVAISLGLK
jgi:hypothetical protein